MKVLVAWLAVTSLAIHVRGAIPENDSFAARIALSGTSVSTTGNNVGATKELDEPDPNFTGGRSVWWTWIAPASGYVTITTAGSSFDTMLTVFTGSSLPTLQLVAFNDTELTTSAVTFNVTAGTAYQIAVDGTDSDYFPTNNNVGSIALQLTLAATQTPPANDNFSNRTVLSGTHLNNVTGSNVGASKEPGEPFHADIIGEKSVWWTWTAPGSGALTLFVQGTSTKGGALDTALAVYTGNSVSNLTFVAGNDEDEFGYESLVTFNVASNVTYQIAVDGFEGDEGSIKLDLDLNSSLAVPTNDNFASRITLTGNTVTTNASNVGASFEPGEPMHLFTFGGKSLWWKWTASASGLVELSTTNSTVDTLLAVYKGTSLSNLVFVAGNDDAALTESTSLAYFNCTAGTTYQIAVDGYDGDAGNITLRLVYDSTPDPVPANDNFANRTTITGTNTTVIGSNIGATLAADEPLHRGYYGGSSVWWTWTSPNAGIVTLDTSNSVPDTLLGVYTGSSLATLTEIASDNNSLGRNWASLVSFPTKSNVTYQIAVDGVDGDAGDLRLRVRFAQAAYTLTLDTNPPAAGTISASPSPDQGGKYAPGSVVTLTAATVGSSTFTGWSGNVSATNNPLVLTMSSNKTITAEFYVPPTTKVWSGGHPNSGNWTTAANWEGGVAPVAGDDLVFPPGAARLAGNTNTFATNTTFKLVTFNGADYILRGNPITLTNGIVCTNASGTNTISLNILLGANQSFQCSNASTRLDLTGGVNLSNRTLTIAGVGDMTMSGVISGTGGIVKAGSGKLSLTGNNTNTYTGTTVVSEGTLDLGKTGVAIPSALTIGDGLGGANADVVRFTANSQIATSSAVTINTSGQLDLNGFTGGVGSLTMTGGNVDTGAGLLGLNGNVTNNASSTQANVTGRLSLQGATRTFNVADGAASVDLLISAVVTNGGSASGITKIGNGTLQLAGANNFSGSTTVNAGTLAVSHTSGLGTTAQGTTVNNSAVLTLGGVSVSSEALALTSATLQADSGSNAWTGTIALTNTCFFSIATNVQLNLSGVLSSSGSATKTGDGTLIYSGNSANSYAGTTTVNQGTLALSKTTSNAIPGSLVIGDGSGGADADIVRQDTNQQIPAGATVTVNSSGLLNLNNTTASLPSLSGSGHVEFGGSSAVLTLGANNATSTFNGLVSGAGQLVKAGNGTLTLTANNTYTGQTTVNGGTLFVNGQQSGSAVVVNSPAVLGGTGRVGNLSGTGTVSPGSSPGILSSGSVTFSPGTTFRVELNGTTVGSGYDQLNVSGTVNLAGALAVTLGFTPAINDSFTIIDNNANDAVTGTFNGLPPGATLTVDGVVFQISYSSGPGANNVVLTRVAPTNPTINAITVQGDVAELQGQGQPGQAYALDTATNVAPPVIWTSVKTNSADTNGVFQFTDGNVLDFPERYYRVRTP